MHLANIYSVPAKFCVLLMTQDILFIISFMHWEKLQYKKHDDWHYCKCNFLKPLLIMHCIVVILNMHAASGW